MILHEMLRHETLAKTLLYSDQLYDFVGYIDKTTFGIACDAMANFRVSCHASACVLITLKTHIQELLTRHKPMVAEFLDKNYDTVSRTYLASSVNMLKWHMTVLLQLCDPRFIRQLCNQTAIAQTARGDFARPDQF